MTALFMTNEASAANYTTNMYVGDSYRIIVGTQIDNQFSYNAAYFTMEQVDNGYLFTLKSPFEGTQSITWQHRSSTASFMTTDTYVITCNKVNVSLYPLEMQIAVGDTQTLQWSSTQSSQHPFHTSRI